MVIECNECLASRGYTEGENFCPVVSNWFGSIGLSSPVSQTF